MGVDVNGSVPANRPKTNEQETLGGGPLVVYSSLAVMLPVINGAVMSSRRAA